MGNESVKQLFSDQLREWADEGIAKIEKEAREDFAELLREAIRQKWLGWEYIQSDLGKVKVGKGEITLHEINEAIDNILKECEED